MCYMNTGTVTSDKVTSGTVTSDKVTSGTVTSDKVTSGTIVMISTLQKLIYSRCQIMFILCFMPKRSI